jgi:hypothetical protein
MEMQQCVLCVMLSYVISANSKEILSIAQKCLDGKFMLPATTKHTYIFT